MSIIENNDCGKIYCASYTYELDHVRDSLFNKKSTSAPVSPSLSIIFGEKKYR